MNPYGDVTHIQAQTGATTVERRVRRRDTCKAPTRLAVAGEPLLLSAGEQTHAQRAEGVWLGKQPAYHAQQVAQRVEEDDT